MIGALVAGQVGSGGAVLSSYESIATASGTGSSGTITFSGIPSTFKHLQIRGIFNDSLGYSTLRIQINSDTGSNYSWHRLFGEPGSSASGQAQGGATQTAIIPGTNGGPTGDTEMGAIIADFLDYGSTTKNKTVRTFSGVASTTSAYNYVAVSSGLWMSTSAITSISLFVSGANWRTNTTFALYGIKEA
jgi:hypothetical protein